MRPTTTVRVGLVVLLAALCAEAQDPWPTHGWAVASPAEVGLDAETLAKFDAELAAGRFGAVTSMLVIRNGRVAYEHSYPLTDTGGEGTVLPTGALSLHDPAGPYNYLNSWWHPYYRRGDLHTMQSVTKTVMSVTVGAALARGELPAVETPILGYFEPTEVEHVDERKGRITIRDLLTMTAGLDWKEDVPFTSRDNSAYAMEMEHDWAGYVIDRPMRHEPGTVFHYSSGASQLLADVFERATGKDLEEYTVRHLFTPLGIDDFFWKRTPTGQTNAEGGLYLRPRDLAKIGYLFLRGGEWEGRQVVASEWVRASVTPSATVSEETGVRYGYCWWLIPYGDGSRLAWGAAGWGGQMLIVAPEQEVVLVFTGWNIREEENRLRHRVALERVLAAIREATPPTSDPRP